MRLIDRLRPRTDEARYTLEDWLAWQSTSFVANGHQYVVPFGFNAGSDEGEVANNAFEAYSNAMYAVSPVVFSCIQRRLQVFSEVRFSWRRYSDGGLWGDASLELLERPWPNGTTGELLARMEQDVSLAGNFFAVRERAAFGGGERLTRLRPDWVDIMFAETESGGYEPAGYVFWEDGRRGGDSVLLHVGETVHWSPIPDPLASYRGMSWLTPVIREVGAHQKATDHKTKFFSNAAVPQMILKMPQGVNRDEFDRFVATFRQQHEGVGNAYKALFLGGGADAQVVGQSFEQMQFVSLQGRAETLIAAASGVPAVLVGLSEGLQASTYSNFAQARRAMADMWARPQWRSACAALASVMTVPAGTELWYDEGDVGFLREDGQIQAEIDGVKARTIRELTDAGYDPNAVIAAVTSGDFSLLSGTHSGLFSVQLQPAGETPPVPEPEPGRSIVVEQDGQPLLRVVHE